jgi:hypothetical protein
VVAVGAVADSIVVMSGAPGEEAGAFSVPNIFDRSLVNIPIIAENTPFPKKLPTGSIEDPVSRRICRINLALLRGRGGR